MAIRAPDGANNYDSNNNYYDLEVLVGAAGLPL